MPFFRIDIMMHAYFLQDFFRAGCFIILGFVKKKHQHAITVIWPVPECIMTSRVTCIKHNKQHKHYVRLWCGVGHAPHGVPGLNAECAFRRLDPLMMYLHRNTLYISHNSVCIHASTGPNSWIYMKWIRNRILRIWMWADWHKDSYIVTNAVIPRVGKKIYKFSTVWPSDFTYRLRFIVFCWNCHPHLCVTPWCSYDVTWMYGVMLKLFHITILAIFQNDLSILQEGIKQHRFCLC